MDFLIMRSGIGSIKKIKESSGFLRYVINDIKVDIVHDPLSIKGIRPSISIDGIKVSIDIVENIFSNKFTTLVSRAESKDFIDFYFLKNFIQEFSVKDLYNLAATKDVIFDDPANVAFALEENLKFIQKSSTYPKMIKTFDLEDMFSFYFSLVKEIYSFQE